MKPTFDPGQLLIDVPPGLLFKFDKTGKIGYFNIIEINNKHIVLQSNNAIVRLLPDTRIVNEPDVDGAYQLIL